VFEMDIFHKDKSKPLDEQQTAMVDEIKTKAEELWMLIDTSVGNRAAKAEGDMGGVINRCGAVAKTELETAVMWAVKGITK